MSMKYRMWLLVSLDVVLGAVALYLALLVRFGIHDFCDEYLLSNPVIPFLLLMVEIFSSYMCECYRFEANFRKRSLVLNCLLAAGLSFLLLSSLYYLSPDIMLGRGILLLAVVFFVTLQILWHLAFFFSQSSPRFQQRVIVVGVGRVAHEISEVVQESHGGYAFLGFVQCTNEQIWPKIDPARIIGNAEQLRDTALSVGADLIIIALTERRGYFPVRDALSCKLNGIELMDAPTFYERVTGSLLLEQITPSWFIYSDGFYRPPVLIALKRLIDILLSSAGLILTVPLFPLIVLLIRLDSPGPVFFSQVRVGNRERHFRLYKFRTMREDAEADTGAVWAKEDDPRVTRLGRFMRKTRIDEIPQLFNVLKGDMSIVGPRPERPEFVEKLKERVPYYSRRHFVKPGVTGWAQVRYPYGASVEDALEKLRYDLYYVKNFSPFLDTLIFFETIKVVLLARGSR